MCVQLTRITSIINIIILILILIFILVCCGRDGSGQLSERSNPGVVDGRDTQQIGLTGREAGHGPASVRYVADHSLPRSFSLAVRFLLLDDVLRDAGGAL